MKQPQKILKILKKLSFFFEARKTGVSTHLAALAKDLATGSHKVARLAEDLATGSHKVARLAEDLATPAKEWAGVAQGSAREAKGWSAFLYSPGAALKLMFT